jgi:fructose-1,6-bisphosphatase
MTALESPPESPKIRFMSTSRREGCTDTLNSDGSVFDRSTAHRVVAETAELMGRMKIDMKECIDIPFHMRFISMDDPLWLKIRHSNHIHVPFVLFENQPFNSIDDGRIVYERQQGSSVYDPTSEPKPQPIIEEVD